jgi:hypothetical protein
MPDDPPATPLTDDQLRAIADLADSPFEAIAKAEAIRALLGEVTRLRAENASLRETIDKEREDRYFEEREVGEQQE